MADGVDGATLVPTSRFGRLLQEARVARGATLDEVADRSGGRFTASRLETIELGEVTVDDGDLAALAALYGLSVETLTPRRAELVIDLTNGTIAAGRATTAVADPSDADAVLTDYLSLLYALRGVEPGQPLPLRDLDVAVLARALGRSRDDVEHRLRRRMDAGAPELRARKRSLGARLIVPAAGILVAATAIGSLVFVTSRDDAPDPSPRERPGAATSGTTADLFAPVPVEPGETSVEVPPLVYERADPDDPPGEPRIPGE